MEVVLLDSDDETENQSKTDKPNTGHKEENEPKAIILDTQVTNIDSDSSIEEVEETQPKKRWTNSNNDYYICCSL